MAPSGSVRLLPSRMKRCPAYCVGRLAAYACQRPGHEYPPHALYRMRERGPGWEEHKRLYDNLRPCLQPDSRGTALYDFFFDREGRSRGPGRTRSPTEAAAAVAAILANRLTAAGYGEDARRAREEENDEADFLAACQQAARIAWTEAPQTPAEMLQVAQCFEYHAREKWGGNRRRPRH